MPSHRVQVLGVRSKVSVSGTREQQVAAIARLQRGRISRRQLRALGIPPATVARWLAEGRLYRLHRGVYAVGHTAAIELGDETAALLALRPGALLCSWTAAVIWGLLPAGVGDGLIHALLVGGPGAHPAGVRVHRARTLAPSDVRIQGGLPLTSPTRTLLDLAAVVTPRQLERAYDEALVRRLVRPAEVSKLLARSNGQSGVRALREVLRRDRGPTLTRSEAEERFLALIRRAGLAAPGINQSVGGFEVDFLWRAPRLIVEIDGYRYHSSRRAFERDHRRDAALSAAGYTTLRFTWRQLVDEPFVVIATVARALA